MSQCGKSADSVSTRLAWLLPSMWEFCGPSRLQVTRLSGGPDPGALQMHQPVLIFTQRINQRAGGKPISIARPLSELSDLDC